MARVNVPQFELVGPACAKPWCKGVLVTHLDLHTQDYFQRCSVCGSEENRMPAREKIAWLKRLIYRILTGEPES